MSNTLVQLIQPIYCNNQIVSYQDFHQALDFSVKKHTSSCFIKSENAFVKGEFRNPDESERKSVLTVFDAITGKIKGDQNLLRAKSHARVIFNDFLQNEYKFVLTAKAEASPATTKAFFRWPP